MKRLPCILDGEFWKRDSDSCVSTDLYLSNHSFPSSFKSVSKVYEGNFILNSIKVSGGLKQLFCRGAGLVSEFVEYIKIFGMSVRTEEIVSEVPIELKEFPTGYIGLNPRNENTIQMRI